MRAFLHPTPKRTVLYSNSPSISMFSFAAKMTKLKLKAETKTTDSYTNQAGQKRFKGNKNLKGTQCLVYTCGSFTSIHPINIVHVIIHILYPIGPSTISGWSFGEPLCSHFLATCLCQIILWDFQHGVCIYSTKDESGTKQLEWWFILVNLFCPFTTLVPTWSANSSGCTRGDMHGTSCKPATWPSGNGETQFQRFLDGGCVH